MTESGEGPAPIPLARQDLSALVGMLALLEGELMSQELTPHFASRLSQRLLQTGLLEPDRSTTADLCQALRNLGHRLRYALGEYPQPPDQQPAPPTS